MMVHRLLILRDAARSQVYAGCVHLPASAPPAITAKPLRGDEVTKEKTRGARAFFVSLAVRRNYAACLCIAPLAGALPRIAFTERSIAAHSRLISAAARPSA